MSADQVADTARILQEALEEFGVEAKVTGVQQGPVVTCYEILPSAGVRVERIKALSDNIALKMHAESIRIQALFRERVLRFRTVSGGRLFQRFSGEFRVSVRCAHCRLAG